MAKKTEVSQVFGEVWYKPAEDKVRVSQVQGEVWYTETKIQASQVQGEVWYLEDDTALRASQVLGEVWFTPAPSSELGRNTTGALDLRFTTPASSFNTIRIRTNIKHDETDTYSFITVTASSGNWLIDFHRLEEGSSLGSTKTLDVSQSPSHTNDWRFYWHNNYISVYIDDKWVYTFATEELVYPASLSVYIYCDQSVSLTDVKVVELHDWRQAVYTETDVNGLSLVSSIIQERPIEMYVDSDGKLRFHYNIDPTPVSFGSKIRSFDEEKAIRDQGGSDFIVYYKDVTTIVDTDFLEDYGFMTRVLRLSNLDTGADFAAETIAKRTRERQTMYRITCRPDLRVEPGDVITVIFTESGTARSTNVTLFVEQVSLSIRSGEYVQVINARIHEGS